ncbi:EFR1 family ferrodoxin [Dethiothermospora halolimnae]|uniref:EFR1 family ferrodoxin n=1 Tax=Dethiothermospora halolimnae TaxID=3114390 RepID=UPI003CCB78E0
MDIKRGKIIFFSGTGNTKYIAKSFEENFKNKDIEIDITSIENIRRFDIKNIDFLVIGAPIYADNVPEFFIKWLKENIPYAEKMIPIILFTTQVSTGAGVHIMERIMTDKNYKVVIKTSFSMPNNYYYAMFSKTPEKRVKEMISNGKNKVEELVEKFLQGKEVKDRGTRSRVFLAKAVGKMFSSVGKKQAQKLTVTEDCIKCGLCVRKCPSNNIILKDKITFKENCYVCTRCIHICPVNAIRYKGKKCDQYNMFLK